MKKKDDTKVKQMAKDVTKEFILLNAGVVLLGLLFVLFPDSSKELLCRAVGAALCLWGLIKFVDYIRARRNEIFGSFAMVQGFALLGSGVYILIKPDLLATILTAALSVLLFIGAVLKLQYTLEFARMSSKGWIVQAIGAVLMIMVSIYAFSQPTNASRDFMIFLGGALIFNGLWDLATMIYIAIAMRSGKIQKPVRRNTSGGMIDAEAEDISDEQEDKSK